MCGRANYTNIKKDKIIVKYIVIPETHLLLLFSGFTITFYLHGTKEKE